MSYMLEKAASIFDPPDEDPERSLVDLMGIETVTFREAFEEASQDYQVPIQESSSKMRLYQR